MKHITIVIPTRNRLMKLRKCLSAIPQLPWVSVIVGVDGDLDTMLSLELNHPFQLAVYSSKHIGSMRTCNLITPMVGDGLLLLCDDMELLPGALEEALSAFNEAFPDDDGVLGFHQEGISSYAPTGVCLMGAKFLSRYPGKQVFNPEYGHFGDVEIYELAAKLDRYKFGGKEVAVYHHHEEDQTHHEGRKSKVADATLRRTRREAGEIWGL